MPKLQQHNFTWNRKNKNNNNKKTNKSVTKVKKQQPKIVKANKKSTLSLMTKTPFPTHCLSSLHSYNKKK